MITSFKNGCAVVGLMLFMVPSLYAQTPDDSLGVILQDLKTPLSPAFVLLGVEPSSIEQPSTPKAVSASLFSAFAKSDLIPDSYALEFAPYWLKSRPDLTFEDHYADHNPGETFSRYLSLSIATSKAPAATDSLSEGSTSIGLGFRSRLVEGSVNEALKLKYMQRKKEIQLRQLWLLIADDLLETDADSLKELKTTVLDGIDGYIDNPGIISFENIEREEALNEFKLIKTAAQKLFAEAAGTYAEGDINNIKTFIAARLNNSDSIKEKALEIQGLSKERVGFIWEIAGAVSMGFPGQKFEDGKLNKFGFWSTMTYRWQEPFIDASLLGRIIREDIPTEDIGVLFDLGGKLTYKVNEFAVSAELVQRLLINGEIDSASDSDATTGSFSVENSFRLAGELEYKIKDGLYLNTTFGKDYKRIGVEGNLIAQIGLNFGFGNKVDLD